MRLLPMRFLKNNVKYLIIFLGIFALAFFSHAEDYSSSNFILRDPVITIAGDQSSSTNFQYFSSSGQLSPGESSSSTFTYRAGFLYFPTATTPIVSASPGNAKVDLTWTASVGSLANITRYQVGTSTVSGGPYTYEDVGNVLAFTKTSLTNGTPYYFKVKADAGTLTLAQSAQVSATPAGSGGGGGGGGGFLTQITFSGKAYPGSTVTLLKDAQLTGSAVADANANFQVTATGLYGGSYIFILYAKDNQGRTSPLVILPEEVTAGISFEVNNIFIGPTIAVDKEETKKGDPVSIVGQSAPNASIKVAISPVGGTQFYGQTTTDNNGNYAYSLSTTSLAMGQYIAKSQATLGLAVSPFSKTVEFKVGTKNVLVKPRETCKIKADLNDDCRVDLVDISILIYWFNSSNPPAKVDLSNDTKVDLIDISIMAYYWTG